MHGFPYRLTLLHRIAHWIWTNVSKHGVRKLTRLWAAIRSYRIEFHCFLFHVGIATRSIQVILVYFSGSCRAWTQNISSADTVCVWHEKSVGCLRCVVVSLTSSIYFYRHGLKGNVSQITELEAHCFVNLNTIYISSLHIKNIIGVTE